MSASTSSTWASLSIPTIATPYTRAFLTVAATFAELEAEIKRENTREGIAASRAQGKWHGRPPFGFDVGPEGYLVPNDDYETALVVLDELDKGASKRELSRRTSVARSTIQHIANNRERYVGEPPKPTGSV